MILLDNQVYITNACNLLKQAPGYRTIPLSISCLTGGDFEATSILNFIATFVTLFLLFSIYDFTKKQKLTATIIFGLNSFIAFPYFYAAAHSYVYTILISVLGVYIIKRINKINSKNIFLLILCALGLKLVRSEGPLYFIITLVPYLIFNYMKSLNLADFWSKNKHKFIMIGTVILSILIINVLLKASISHGEKITKNLADGKYASQFPRDTFYAVSLWATFDYLRAFLTPYYMNFYGNYNDWFTVHKNQNLRIILYLSFSFLSLLSSFYIIRRKKSSFSYLIIGFSIFIIPGFLISSFLRNQWYYPSRGLLGCIISLPFFIQAFLLLKKEMLKKMIALTIGFFFISTFFIHNQYHFKNEQSMYDYETTLLGNNHPTLSKTYAQLIFKQKDFLKSTKILRQANRILNEEGVFLSANMFFLWAENLYWSAASSFFYKSPLTEEMVLKKLYKHPNFFSGLACVQDTRVPIEDCTSPKYLRSLCHPLYKKRFGYKYYKKPRIKIELLCSKHGSIIKN